MSTVSETIAVKAVTAAARVSPVGGYDMFSPSDIAVTVYISAVAYH